jgi:hypothetical protein
VLLWQHLLAYKPAAVSMPSLLYNCTPSYFHCCCPCCCLSNTCPNITLG